MSIDYLRWVRRETLPEVLSSQKLKIIRQRRDGTVEENWTALWIYRSGGSYEPGRRIRDERELINITFSPQGETLLTDPRHHFDFEDPDFAGEAGHPDQIIIKANERGSYGIGKNILAILNQIHIVNIRKA